MLRDMNGVFGDAARFQPLSQGSRNAIIEHECKDKEAPSRGAAVVGAEDAGPTVFHTVRTTVTVMVINVISQQPPRSPLAAAAI